MKLALSLGTAASDEDDHERARSYLSWAKHLAPRSAVVRESFAIALYRSGDLHAALSELQAYRRLSGSDDQNHLLADCLRAEGRDLDRAIEIGKLLAESKSADPERRAEAAIVVASILLGLGRPGRARATLAPFLEGQAVASLPVHASVRTLWVAADIAEAEGALGEAVELLERLRSLDPEYPDVQDRLDRLSDGGDR